MTRILIIGLALLPLIWLVAAAEAGAATGDVVINEVLLWPGSRGVDLPAYATQWVEIHNGGTAPVDLTGWIMTGRSGQTAAALPPWVLPAGAYLTVHWDSGTDDADFSDDEGHHYLNDTSRPFDRDRDECALHFAQPPSAVNTADFVAWASGGSYTPGSAHDRAVAAGVWTQDSFVDPGVVHTTTTLGRVFNGWDTDVPGDWGVFGWLDYIRPGFTQPRNPAQIAPRRNRILSDSMPAFDWQSAGSVTSYQLQVDNDADFSSPEIDVEVAASEHTPATPLPDDVYFFRVRGSDGSTFSAWSAKWLFAVDTDVTTTAASAQAGCPFKYQRKDTNLLCIWHSQDNTRPGCVEGGAHPWDGPHPDVAPTGDEAHCAGNCARAAIAMINARYGGDLSQDRISYHIFHDLDDQVPGPEGDLGHDGGVSEVEIFDTLTWALNDAPILAHTMPPSGFDFTQIKDWYDERGCFLVTTPAHAVVVNGYVEKSKGTRTVQGLKVHDPSEGPDVGMLFDFLDGGVSQEDGLKKLIEAVFLQPAPPIAVTARMQEAAVTTDIDGDGVMDFDEQQPRPFQSVMNDADTDDDEVDDKNDIRNYTFHDSYHIGHENDPLGFSDLDGDGLRSENDCDSDSPDGLGGDGDFDGGEDIDGDGHNLVPFLAGSPETRETCMFDDRDFLETIHVDRDVYMVGQPVFVVDTHPERPTHTYHADSFYSYELGFGCPDKMDNTALRHDGLFFTDSGGHAMPAFVFNCPAPGFWYLTMDVLNDFNYSEPDNTDPQTCFACLAGRLSEPYSDAFSTIQIEIPPGSGARPVTIRGSATVEADLDSLGDSDMDGLEEVDQRLADGVFTGTDPFSGRVTLRVRDAAQHPMQPSTGVVEEDSNPTVGVPDLPPFSPPLPPSSGRSVFDLYFEMELSNPPRTFHSHDPMFFSGTVSALPAGTGDRLDSASTVLLYDDAEAVAGGIGPGFLIFDPVLPAVSEPGFTVTPFGPGVGAKGIECSPGGVWGDYLYVSDSAVGAVERVDFFDNSTTFATGLGFPVGGAFGPGKANDFGDFFYVADFGFDQVSRIDPLGNVSPFTSIANPGDLAFGTNGAYGTDLYATTAFTGPTLTINNAGAPSFFSSVPATYIDFGPGGAWGGDLYGTQAGGSVTFNLTQTANAAIPDAPAPGTPGPPLNLPVTFPQSNTIDDVDVRVNIQHERISDLEIRILYPGGTRVNLWQRGCDTGTFRDLQTTFDDEGTAKHCNPFGPTPDPNDGDGRFPPSSALSALDGGDAQGPWTLEIIDHAPGATGTLIDWTLGITQSNTGITRIALGGSSTMIARGFQGPEGFDWAFGGDWAGDMFATDVTAGQIHRVKPDGTRTLWADLPGAADVAFCNCSLYVVSADGGCWKATSDADDADGDGHGDLCDNCSFLPNPSQEPVVFPHSLDAVDETSFGWGQPATVDYMRGPLDQVGTYAVDMMQRLVGADSFVDTETPLPGAGFYYMAKPACPAGSWQTTIGFQPGRDGI